MVRRGFIAIVNEAFMLLITSVRIAIRARISFLSAFYQLFQNSIKTFTVTPSTVQPVEIIATAKKAPC
jgi:hypothetical protein